MVLLYQLGLFSLVPFVQASVVLFVEPQVCVQIYLCHQCLQTEAISNLESSLLQLAWQSTKIDWLLWIIDCYMENRDESILI